MPLPFIIGAAAALAGAAGVGAGIHGGVKMKEANDTIKCAQRRHEDNMQRFESENEKTTQKMDELGKAELEIITTFERFSHLFEQIKNRPVFEEYSIEGVDLPKYDGEKLKKVSVGAAALLSGLGGAGLGAAGGFAAAGATTAAVMALGTASTGTAIASLSGAAATNAALAALGGGAIAAGGGGIALGTAILGGATLGVGLLVGGIIFNFSGGKLSDKADEAWDQMKEAERKINKICDYLEDLRKIAVQYNECLSRVNSEYDKRLNEMHKLIMFKRQTDWNSYSTEDRKMIENTVLLVGLLYQMCKVQIVIKNDSSDGMNTINKEAVDKSVSNAEIVLGKIQSEE